ncbi:MAG TPA: vitamin K epoxide reductase family protein [Gemmatimonadales bacterium]
MTTSTSADPGFTPRHWIAATAALSGLVALYLHLWKLGYMGALVCNAQHSCEFVMTSRWGQFLGIDVALIGTIGYTLILITALVGLNPKYFTSRGVTLVLAVLIVFAFLFTLRLKYYEFFVLKSFCRWCAVSAITITTHVIAVALDWRRVRHD